MRHLKRRDSKQESCSQNCHKPREEQQTHHSSTMMVWGVLLLPCSLGRDIGSGICGLLQPCYVLRSSTDLLQGTRILRGNSSEAIA